MGHGQFFKLDSFDTRTDRVLVIVSHAHGSGMLPASLEPDRLWYVTNEGRLKKVPPSRVDVLATPEMHTPWTQLVAHQQPEQSRITRVDGDHPFSPATLPDVIRTCQLELDKTAETVSVGVLTQVRKFLRILSDLVVDSRMRKEDFEVYEWFSRKKQQSHEQFTWKSVADLMRTSPKDTVKVLLEIFTALSNEKSKLYEIINTAIDSFLSVRTKKMGVFRDKDSEPQREACLFHLATEAFFLSMAVKQGYKLVYAGKRIDVMCQLTDLYCESDRVWAKVTDVVSQEDRDAYRFLSDYAERVGGSFTILFEENTKAYNRYAQGGMTSQDVLRKLPAVREFFCNLHKLKETMLLSEPSPDDGRSSTTPHLPLEVEQYERSQTPAELITEMRMVSSAVLLVCTSCQLARSPMAVNALCFNGVLYCGNHSPSTNRKILMSLGGGVFTRGRSRSYSAPALGSSDRDYGATTQRR